MVTLIRHDDTNPHIDNRTQKGLWIPPFSVPQPSLAATPVSQPRSRYFCPARLHCKTKRNEYRTIDFVRLHRHIESSYVPFSLVCIFSGDQPTHIQTSISLYPLSLTHKLSACGFPVCSSHYTNNNTHTSTQREHTYSIYTIHA